MKHIIFSLMVFGVVLMSCSKDEPSDPTPSATDCTNTDPTYTMDVKPLMDTYCATAGCHNATTNAAGRDYSTYTSTKNKASEAAFLGSIRHQSGYEAMPRGGSKLSDEQIQTIDCWV